jgi:hypothetical protein
VSVTASTKRNPAPIAGKVGAAAVHLAAVELAYEPIPVSPEVVEKYKLQSPRKTFVTGAFGNPDILEGDLLCVSGADYIVRAVGKFTAPVAYLKLIVEQVK